MVVAVVGVSCCFFKFKLVKQLRVFLCKQLVVIAHGRYPKKPLKNDFFYQ